MVKTWVSATLVALLATTAFSDSTLELTEYDTEGAIVDVVWCGNNNEVVFVQTDKNTVYRSHNKGFKWKPMNNVMQ